MRGQQRTASLHAIARIRGIQRIAAEGEAARAAMALDETRRRAAQAEALRDNAEADWLAALDQPSRFLEMTNAWSAELRRREGDVQSSQRADAAAAEALDRRRDAWMRALGQEDVARERARSALREQRRRREEKAVQSMSDRSAMQRRSG